MGGALNIGFFVVLLLLFFARLRFQAWLMRQHMAGRMGGRKAGWLYAAALAAPFALIVVYIAFRDIGSALVAAVVLVLFLPIWIIPWVSIFRYPDDTPESKRFPRPPRS